MEFVLDLWLRAILSGIYEYKAPHHHNFGKFGIHTMNFNNLGHNHLFYRISLSAIHAIRLRFPELLLFRCTKISCNITRTPLSKAVSKQYNWYYGDNIFWHAASTLPIWGRIESCRNAPQKTFRFYFEQYNPALETYCPWSINIWIPYLRCKMDNSFELELL